MTTNSSKPFGIEYLEPMADLSTEAAFGGQGNNVTCNYVSGTASCSNGGVMTDDDYCICGDDSVE